MLDIALIKTYYGATLRTVAINCPVSSELAVTELLVDAMAKMKADGKPAFEKVYVWNLVTGLRDLSPRKPGAPEPKPEALNPETLLKKIRETELPSVFICSDIHSLISNAPHNQMWVRQFLETCQRIELQNKFFIMLGDNINFPDTFDGSIRTIDLPLPSYEEIEAIFDTLVANLFSDQGISTSIDPNDKPIIIRALQGLTHEEINDLILLSVAKHRGINISKVVSDSVSFKKEKLLRRGVSFAPPGDVPCCGLDVITDWAKEALTTFSPEAKEYDIPNAKGMLLIGYGGTGKSLTVKSLASIWGMPVLSLNISEMMSSLVGSSEQNLRVVLKMAVAIAPCILFMDQLDKAFAGAMGTSTDGGTSQRMLAEFLIWFADRLLKKRKPTAFRGG